MKNRTNEAIWIERQQRWSIKVQRDGQRKAFYSSKKGRKGKVESERKADEWLEAWEIKDLRFGVYGHEVDGEAAKAAAMVDGIFDKLL